MTRAITRLATKPSAVPQTDTTNAPDAPRVRSCRLDACREGSEPCTRGGGESSMASTLQGSIEYSGFERSGQQRIERACGLVLARPVRDHSRAARLPSCAAQRMDTMESDETPACFGWRTSQFVDQPVLEGGRQGGRPDAAQPRHGIEITDQVVIGRIRIARIFPVEDAQTAVLPERIDRSEVAVCQT